MNLDRLREANDRVERLCDAGDLHGAIQANFEARRIALQTDFSEFRDRETPGPESAAAPLPDRAPDSGRRLALRPPFLACRNCGCRSWSGGWLLWCSECERALLDLFGAAV